MSFLKTLLLISVSFVVLGCQNTIQGFGKDMEKSGQELQKSVSKES